ncbi:pleckstrin homology domain-containing family M member 1 [Osmerus mordax]|uniref:pleckstrin homology domain-containing family M member 1 n=1 Tax=Osmerus mordax TaxID=8014 RepID=UPI00350EE587
MLATQTLDTGPEVKDVKLCIKEKLALALKVLQKRYVTTDAMVTSEDGDANLLCCTLEAVFIHGIKSKYIRYEAGGRNRKEGSRGPLPQPVFWSLLKSVTHRDVITEVEKLCFVGTDVGRCRAWVRLALNHGLVECYLAALFREGSKLQGHYQPNALLLNPEEREVLLSYLQGLGSLTFNLSYKSSVLNEWTTTPLVLSGLCPASQGETVDLFLNGASGSSYSKCKESWDTASQSSCGSDTVEVQQVGLGAVMGRGMGAVVGGRSPLNSSNLSLDTTGSSQLSSSLSSDSLLQGHDPRSSDKEPWPCDLEISSILEHNTKRPFIEKSGHSSQDSMREDSYVSSSGTNLFSETTAISGSDSETQGHAALCPDSETQGHAALCPDLSDLQLETRDQESPPTEIFVPSAIKPSLIGPVGKVEKTPDLAIAETPQIRNNGQEKKAENSSLSVSEPSGKMDLWQSACMHSRKMSADFLSHSYSWISEDDIYKPHLDILSDHAELHALAPAHVNCSTSPPLEPKAPQSPPSVIHRRQIGLSNPFRGLLKLGHLERRGAVGMWRDHYCELSPFEFRLYLNTEERTCCDNCSLLRCEDARITSSEGRFELTFPGKRLYLRAANQDEAEDWVDRIIEAVNKCRPLPCSDDLWEVLQPTSRQMGFAQDEPPCSLLSSTSSVPSSPERMGTAVELLDAGGEKPVFELDWTRPTDLESDSIKEAVLYLSTDPEVRTWVPLVFSLSLETLKGFNVQEERKVPLMSQPIKEIRDIVPDVSLGGPAFFKILTTKETLKLRAETPEDARSWRTLIRGALDSYLESGEDGVAEEPGMPSSIGGNIHRLVQHRLKGDGLLLAHLYAVPIEKGLDAQSFKCAGCPKQIGVSLGKARLCEFTGQYFCDSCHLGDTSIIPSRMVHNWDLSLREISRQALKLLTQIEHEPLLHLDLLNSNLWDHTEDMIQARNLRQKLRLLGDYVLICRSGVGKKVKARLDQRTYLLESSHLYSVLDLQQIADGQYAAYLNTLIQFASSHVHQCDLCTQRGFICQICQANDIIFPFQFETTVRCMVCKAVFHTACKTQSLSCPRCLRLQKYLERDLKD